MDRQRILIVEDSKPTRDHLEELVKSLDVETVALSGASEARECISSTTFSAAILDIDLGSEPANKYAGLELLTRLSSVCPVIVVSGMQEESFQGISLTLRAYDFIAKPINDLDFINKVRHALKVKIDPPEEQHATAPQALPDGLTRDPKRSPGFLWMGKRVRLTMTELRLVYALVETPYAYVPSSKLSKAMDSGDAKSLANHMMGVRRKFCEIDPAFDRIRNKPGLGYVWDRLA